MEKRELEGEHARPGTAAPTHRREKEEADTQPEAVKGGQCGDGCPAEPIGSRGGSVRLDLIRGQTQGRLVGSDTPIWYKLKHGFVLWAFRKRNGSSWFYTCNLP